MKLSALLPRHDVHHVRFGDAILLEAPARQAEQLPLVAQAARVREQMADGDARTIVRNLRQILSDVVVDESLSSRASSMIAMAVNCFETDATWKIDAGVMGVSVSRFAIP